MKNIYIIRHAESASNAGEVTYSHDTIPLTKKGKAQAEELAHAFDITPDLIVVSSYSRTQETAAPFISKHTDIPVELWGVHEFTCLHPEEYSGTTKANRAQSVQEYWENAHPTWKASEQSESFYELSQRVEAFIEKVKSRPEKTIVIFSHGRFIYALKLHLARLQELGVPSLPEEEISLLKQMHASGVREKTPFPIGNVSIHKIEL